MESFGLSQNGKGQLRGQSANPGSPGKMAVKTECVSVCVCVMSFVSPNNAKSLEE